MVSHEHFATYGTKIFVLLRLTTVDFSNRCFGACYVDTAAVLEGLIVRLHP